MMRDKHLTLDEINARFKPKNLEFVSLSEDASGFVNKTVFLTEKSGKEYVLRLCSTMERFKHEKTKNEVNIFKRLQKIGGVPAPTVFDFCSSAENPFECEYILMDRLPGKPLGKEIQELFKEQIYGIMRQLVDKFQGMWSERFEASGTLDVNGKPAPMLLLGGKGPFKTKEESVRAFMGLMLEDGGEAFDCHQEKILKLIDGILITDKSQPVFFCFAHNDLNFDNMLVENDQLSGIVDWEWAGASGFEQEVFNCDFYRNLEYREDFLTLLDEKMGFDVHKAMADSYDRNAAGLGALLLGWHPRFGLKPDDPMVVQWVTELERLMSKYGVFDGKLL